MNPKEAKKNMVVMKAKYSVGKCTLCKNNARWIVQITDCASISRVPMCDKHRPKNRRAVAAQEGE